MLIKIGNDKDHKLPLILNGKSSNSDPKNIHGLVNALLLSREYDSFNVPGNSEIKSLKPGDFVKLARNHERFWVEIDGFIGRKWHGTISNDLILNEDISFGDKIFFMKKNIYDTMRK